MDLVYIVGRDPKHNYLELRYSIRSMARHLDKIGKLVIVGVCPPFLKNVIHIPVEDAHVYNPARNIYEKILAACNDRRVSASFLCCSDDYFLLRDFSSERFPYFYSENMPLLLRRTDSKGAYYAHLKNTMDVLQARNLQLRYFNVHAPIIYKKQLFKKVMAEYDWTIKKGYISKSLYCNSIGIEGDQTVDCKIFTPKTLTAIKRKLEGQQYFSINEYSLNDEMKIVLQDLYPFKSKWEL